MLNLTFEDNNNSKSCATLVPNQKKKYEFFLTDICIKLQSRKNLNNISEALCCLFPIFTCNNTKSLVSWSLWQKSNLHAELHKCKPYNHVTIFFNQKYWMSFLLLSDIWFKLQPNGFWNKFSKVFFFYYLYMQKHKVPDLLITLKIGWFECRVAKMYNLTTNS